MPAKPSTPVYPGTRVLCLTTRGRILLIEAQAHHGPTLVCETCQFRGPCGRLQSELRSKKGG